MSDEDLITTIALLWVQNGGDANSFWLLSCEIEDKIVEIMEKQKDE